MSQSGTRRGEWQVTARKQDHLGPFFDRWLAGQPVGKPGPFTRLRFLKDEATGADVLTSSEGDMLAMMHPALGLFVNTAVTGYQLRSLRSLTRRAALDGWRPSDHDHTVVCNKRVYRARRWDKRSEDRHAAPVE